MDVVIFKLGGRSYGVDLVAVKEVLRLGFVTPVPLSPATIIGAMHVRGQVLPVVDLSCLLTGEASRPTMGETCLRVAPSPYHALLYVGRVDEVTQVDPPHPAPSPARHVEQILDTPRGRLELLSPQACLDSITERTEALLDQLRLERIEPPVLEDLEPR